MKLKCFSVLLFSFTPFQFTYAQSQPQSQENLTEITAEENSHHTPKTSLLNEIESHIEDHLKKPVEHIAHEVLSSHTLTHTIPGLAVEAVVHAVVPPPIQIVAEGILHTAAVEGVAKEMLHTIIIKEGKEILHFHASQNLEEKSSSELDNTKIGQEVVIPAEEANSLIAAYEASKFAYSTVINGITDFCGITPTTCEYSKQHPYETVLVTIAASGVALLSVHYLLPGYSILALLMMAENKSQKLNSRFAIAATTTGSVLFTSAASYMGWLYQFAQTAEKVVHAVETIEHSAKEIAHKGHKE